MILEDTDLETKKEKKCKSTNLPSILTFKNSFKKKYIWMAWQVQKISNKVYVKPIKGDAQSPKFKHRQKKGAFHFLLPEELKIEENNT